MSKSYLFGTLLAAGLLARLPSLAQGMPSYSPPPMAMPGTNMNMPINYGSNPNYRKGSGSYQLADGSWQRAQALVFNGEKLVVKDSPDGKQKLDATTLRQLEVAQDTFVVAQNLPGAVADTPEFVESLFNQHGLRVLSQQGRYGGRPQYFLARPQRPPELLPARNKAFKAALLPVVQGCPTLASNITAGVLGYADVVKIMQLYVACRWPVPAASN